jgi:hypothetical protein
METTLVTLATLVGDQADLLVPRPSSPTWFVPQVQTLPSERNAIAWFCPAEMESVESWACATQMLKRRRNKDRIRFIFIEKKSPD